MLHALRRINADNVDQWIDLVLDGFDPAEISGRGVIFVTAHMGSWEVLGALSALVGYPLWSLARPLDNPLLDRLVVRHREQHGQHILDRRGAILHAMRLLRAGEHVAFLVDQDARRRGVFVPFFGRPASTVASVARLSIATGAPVVFCYALRETDELRFKVYVDGPLWPDPGVPRDEEIVRITATFTRWIEQAVRKSPERWLWLHRRWKTVPTEEQMLEYERRFPEP
jgi:KDO2-lipid IV(A) lauroyltransferase